jgi:hypothetical protein
MTGKQVMTTTDYFLFRSIDGNRKINTIHLKRLDESIKKRYVFTVIIVNEKYEIIDGQHRFECIKKHGLPLNYIVCNGYGLKEVHLLNANSSTWKSDDYMNGYADIGIDDYIVFREFRNKYKFGHNESIFLLGAGCGSYVTKDFVNGRFKIKNYNEAVRKANLLESLKPYYPGYKRRSFVFAIKQLLENKDFVFSEFLNKVKANPMKMIDLPSVDAYLELIEGIYNYKRRDKVNLRFKKQ